MSQPTKPAPDRAPRAPDEGRGLLALQLGDARFGLWVDEVLEIVATPPISRLPLARPEVAGVTSVRGEVVPVLDLGLRLLDAPARRPGRVVLVRGTGDDTLLGLLVDGVDTLVTVGDDEIRDAPGSAETGLAPDLIRGVAVPRHGEVVTILDLERATAPPAAQQNGE